MDDAPLAPEPKSIKCRELLLSPIFATGLTLLILFTGGFGSLYSSEIRNARPFTWDSPKPTWEALFFWLFAALSGAGFFCRESAVASKQTEMQRANLLHGRQLVKMIRTLPPENFLSVFSQFFSLADYVFQAAFDRGIPKSRETLEASCRHILRMIATLAQKFDGDVAGTEYAANIMVFRPSESLSEDEEASLRPRLLFTEETTSIRNLRGVLQLIRPLSTIASDKSVAPDTAIPEIVLCIPKTLKNGSKYKIMPGAPLAFTTRHPELFADGEALFRWCREHCDFTSEVLDSVAKYFKDSPVEGFLSIPLFANPEHLNSDEGQNDPIAILNVHCDTPGLLAQGEALAHFVDISKPFCILLVRLLSHLFPDRASID